jgi:predicted P-loop ATPase
MSTVVEVGPGQDATDWLAGVAVAAQAAMGAAKAGAGQPSPDNVKAAANVEAMSLDAVFDALEALRPEREASEVIASLKGYAASKPRSKIADAFKGVVPADWSSADQFLCCEAIRRGAGNVEDVIEVWEATPLSERGKFDDRKDYRARTVKMAARAVLKGLREDAARGGRGAAPAAPVALPEGLSEALALSGDTLKKGGKGQILAQSGNVELLFGNAPDLKGLIGFNELTQQAYRLRSWQALGQHANSKPGPLEDDDVTRVEMYLQRAFGMNIDHRALMRAIDASAKNARFDPLADALRSFKWDGVQRVDTWLVDWLKVDTSHGDGAYISTAGKCFLVGAVARALSPGCKMDTVLSVEGSGGGGKSTAFRVLADAVGPNLFADGVQDLSSTAAIVEGTGGRWIVEVAELAGVRKAEVNALKAALSQQTDTHRRPYEVLPREVPRRFVFVATTNSSEYLNDPTGALLRRFHPVRTLATEQNPIDRAGLAKDAPQLWAEAVHLFNAGVKWHIGAEDGPAYKQWVGQREQRRVEGAFQEEVTEFLEVLSGEEAVRGWCIKEIAQRVGDQKTAENDGGARMRLADTLKALKMERRKVSGYWRWFKAPSGAAQPPVKRPAATGRK